MQKDSPSNNNSKNLSEEQESSNMADEFSENYVLQSQLLLPFQATPENFIRHLLEAIKLPKNSLLLDLGSGDGRVINIAVSEFNIRAIGLEINKNLYQESLEMLERLPEHLKDRGKIYRNDFFNFDLSGVDAIFAYVTPKTYNYLLHSLKSIKMGIKLICVRFEPPLSLLKNVGFELEKKISIDPEYSNKPHTAWIFEKIR